MKAILLGVYLLFLLVLTLIDVKKIHSLPDFIVAGRSRGLFIMIASLIASVLGASATLGVMDLAYRVGFPAVWWLGSGSIGLLLSGILLGRKLYRYQCLTLADLIQHFFGKAARKLVAILIAVAWSGVIAAQFIAAAKLVQSLLGLSYPLCLTFIGIFIIFLCVLGGQRSVFKTDSIQFLFILFGLVTTFLYLTLKKSSPASITSTEMVSSVKKEPFFQLFNDNFKIQSIFYYLLIVGSGFMIGPDIFTRLFSAKSEKVARKAPIIAAIILFTINLVIVGIGLWAKNYQLDVPKGEQVLMVLMKETLPPLLTLLLSFTLLSAVLSSADTCLMSSASTFSYDLLQSEKVLVHRIVAMTLGFISIVIAYFKADLISTLLITYSIFNTAVVPPLFVAILLDGKRKTLPVAALLAITSGAICGLLSSFLHLSWIAMMGMGISLTLSLITKKVESQQELSAKG